MNTLEVLFILIIWSAFPPLHFLLGMMQSTFWRGCLISGKWDVYGVLPGSAMVSQHWSSWLILRSLKIIFLGAPNSGEVILLPLNLKKPTLSNFHLQQNHISRIGELLNLRVLTLCAASFEGQTWDMREDDFKELKFLQLRHYKSCKMECFLCSNN